MDYRIFPNFDDQEKKMISDILFQCVVELDAYLNSPTYDRTCQGDLRERIIRLRNEAEYIRVILDTPPDCSLPPEPVLLDRIAAQRDRMVEDRRYVLRRELQQQWNLDKRRGEVSPLRVPVIVIGARSVNRREARL
jgi:hypothetical protein